MSPKFVSWYANTVGASYFLLEGAQTTNLASISISKLGALPVHVPPLNEQRRIVAKLEELLARCRRAKDALDAIPPLHKRLRQSVLAAAFRGDLTAEWRAKNPNVEPAEELLKRTPAPKGKSTGRAAGVDKRPGRHGLAVGNPDRELPPSWLWAPLERLARLESGHTPSRQSPEYWNEGIPWIGIKDARDHHGREINTTLQSVSEAGLANSAARLLPARTVCLSRTASVGYVTIMGKPMATSQDFANWVCSDSLIPEFLMYALLAEGNGLHEFGEGTTHTTIYYPELKALHISLPPIAEQVAIVDLVKRRLADAERVAGLVETIRGQQERLVPSLLSKAFRGELVEQDPNDEPAGAVLERLAAERQAALETPAAATKRSTRQKRRA
jgi:type I restriction enzyme, S subunit